MMHKVPLVKIAHEESLKWELNEDAISLIEGHSSVQIIGCLKERDDISSLFEGATKTELKPEASEDQTLTQNKDTILYISKFPESDVFVLSLNRAGAVENKVLPQARAVLLLLASSLHIGLEGNVDTLNILEDFRWLQSISKEIKVFLNQDEETAGQYLGQHMPQWVVWNKDFKASWLRVTNHEDGTVRKRSTIEYMEEKLLEEENAFSESAMERNHSKALLKLYFPERNWITIPKVSNSTYDTQIEKTRKFIIKETKQKRIEGQLLSGSHWWMIMQHYLEEMNNGKTPCVRGASTFILNETYKGCYESALMDYESSISQKFGFRIGTEQVDDMHALTTQVLLSTHSSCKEAGQRIIDSLFLSSFNDKEILKKYENMYLTKIECAISDFIQANESNSNLSCERTGFLAELEALLLNSTLRQTGIVTGPGKEYTEGLQVALLSYKIGIESAISRYRSIAVGPSVPKYENIVLEMLLTGTTEWGDTIMQHFKKHLNDVKKKLHLSKTELAHVLGAEAPDCEVDVQKELFEQSIQKESEHEALQRKRMKEEMEYKKSEIDRIYNEKQNRSISNEATCKRQLALLSELHKKNAELEKDALIERERREVDVKEVNREIVNTERDFHQEEKSLMYGRNDLMTKMMNLEREIAQSNALHLQKTFQVEQESTSNIHEEKKRLDEGLRKLKDRANDDMASLRRAHDVCVSKLKRELLEWESKESKMKERIQTFMSQNNDSNSDICTTN